LATTSEVYSSPDSIWSDGKAAKSPRKDCSSREHHAVGATDERVAHFIVKDRDDDMSEFALKGRFFDSFKDL
jgi:hypothetical protein